MGDMALSDFREAVRMSLHQRSDLLDTQLTRWIDWAYKYVSHPSFRRHEELRYGANRTLVEGDYIFNLAIGGAARVCNVDNVTTCPPLGVEIAGIEGVYVNHITQGPNATECPKTKLTPGDARMFDQGVGTRGLPTRYAIRTLDLWFSPPAGPEVVGDQLNVRYWAIPLRMDDTTALIFPGYGADKTVIQAIWDDAIVLLARWRGAIELNLPYDERAAAFREFQAITAPLRDHRTITAEDWNSSSFELSLQPYQHDGRG